MALQITIIQARGLPSADLNGLSDPYAEFIVNGVKHKTKTIKKTLNPYWGETFTFHAASFNPNTDSIRLDIYDWDRFSSNDLLTRNLLPISKYVAAGTIDEWIPLNSVKGGCHGSVQLKVIYGDGKPKVQPQQGGYAPVRSAPPVPQQQSYYGGGYPPQQQSAPAYPMPPQHQPAYGQPPYGYAPPPQQHQAYPSGGFPPQSGGYPPQQQAYPSGGYPPQSGGYPPQQQGLQAPQGGYPPQSGGYPPQHQQQGLQAPRWSGPSYGLPPHEIREAEEAFWRYDTDKSGTIDRNELKPLLRAIFGNRMSENLMDRYASAHFQSADTDRSGQIDFGEFLNLYSKLKPLANGRAV